MSRCSLSPQGWGEYSPLPGGTAIILPKLQGPVVAQRAATGPGSKYSDKEIAVKESCLPEEKNEGRFSQRHGYQGPDQEITIREDAPESLRFAVLQIARDLGMAPSTMREIVCGVLLSAPNPDNWSEYPNIWEEVKGLLRDCEWYQVYDVAEALYDWLSSYPTQNAPRYEERLYEYFREHGIGWQMHAGNVVVRGSETFELVTRKASETLVEHARGTAAREIHEALGDLSRRPEPDISGAIQHAMAALECVARDVAGEDATLGDVIHRHAARIGIRPPLDQALHKLWGYASQEGRHLQEGRDPGFEEAELVVSVAAAVSVYLSKKANRD